MGGLHSPILSLGTGIHALVDFLSRQSGGYRLQAGQLPGLSWVVGICGSGDVVKCRFMNKNRPEEGKWLESHTVFNCINDFSSVVVCCGRSESRERKR